MFWHRCRTGRCAGSPCKASAWRSGPQRRSRAEKSKSARRCDGGHYLLRLASAHAFGDTGLESLIGASIKVHGTAIGRTLIMRDWEKLPES
jgi:hypothetical protein